MYMNLEAYKDGNGNIVITEGCFEHLLNCLDNQKLIDKSLSPFGIDAESQLTIDEYNKKCRKLLNQKYVFGVKNNGLSLYKIYDGQTKVTKWSNVDVIKVQELFKDTKRSRKVPDDLLPLDKDDLVKWGDRALGKTKDGFIYCKPVNEPWLIERPMRYDDAYLSISEDGSNNRQWTNEEIDKIKKLFNNYV